MAQFSTFTAREFFGFRLIILSLSLFIGAIQSMGQTKVVFSENFDNATSLQPWAPYYSTGWINKSTNSLTSVSGRGKVFHVNFAANSVGTDHGLGNYRIPLDSAYKELYLSWEYYVPTNFDFGFGDGIGGGKFFGGFSGGSMTAIPNTDATDVDGWVSMFMFQNGYFSTYNYFKGSSFSSGGWPLGNRVASIVKGQWRRITIRLKVNDGDQANGLFEVFDNDVLVYQLPNTKIVNGSHPEYLIEHIYLNNFFGGTGAQYVSPINQYMEFDNIVAFYYPNGTSGYRSGASESGRKIQVPQATSYHPVPPNRFVPSVYTDASGTINSHCGYYQPVDNTESSQTSTIQVAGATSLTINVTKFKHDQGVNYIGYKQILKIYQGTGTSKVLKKTLQNGISTAPCTVTISGGSATIEWQAGQGSHNGFSLNYTSNGTGSGKNFKCTPCTAKQSGGGSAPVTLPAAPSVFAYSNLTDRSLTLSWKDNSSNETGFQIEKKNPDGSVQVLNAGANATSYNVSGLVGHTDYTFRIRSTNSAGSSAWSGDLKVTTNYALPNAPTNLVNKGTTATSVSLSWTDNSGIEDGFKIERSLSSTSGFTEIASVSANVTSYTNSSCSSGTTYYYRVRAYNPAGNTAYTGIVAATTTGTTNPPPASGLPTAPVSLATTSQTSSTITLTWSDKCSRETGFIIERSLSPTTGFATMGKVGANVTTYTNTTLRSGATYYYRVCAYNSSGNSAYTNVLTAKTLSAAKIAGINDSLVSGFGHVESVNQPKISLYPNPSAGMVNINVYAGEDFNDLNNNNDVQFSIISMNGSTVFSKFISLRGGSEHQEYLDLHELPNGMYFVVVQRGEQILKEKLIISK